MTRSLGRLLARATIVCAMTASLASCMGGGLGLETATVDKSISTNSVPGQYVAQPDSVSDDATVRNAVSSADLGRYGDETTIPWANTSTGSAGVIAQIREENNGSYVCRTFVTTRHSYRGISKFAGKACLVGSGTWQMISFREQA